MQFFQPSTLFTGQKLIQLARVDSTNSYAMQLLHQSHKPPEGTAIMAEEQTRGRGQREQTWIAEKGKNLTLSYIFYPGFLSLKHQFDLNIAVALAVAETIQSFTEQKVEIKWPNDILINSRKVAGILIENSIQGENIAFSIVGMGINCNQKGFDYDKAPNATSIFNITGLVTPIDKVFATLSEFLEKRYLQLRAGKQAAFMDDYLERLYHFNSWQNYLFKESPLKAKIIGVSPIGRLQLLTEQNAVLEADLKEIKFIFP